MSSFLQKPGMDLADTYITFIRQNQDILRDRINDELHVEEVFEVSARSHALILPGLSTKLLKISVNCLKIISVSLSK